MFTGPREDFCFHRVYFSLCNSDFHPSDLPLPPPSSISTVSGGGVASGRRVVKVPMNSAVAKSPSVHVVLRQDHTPDLPSESKWPLGTDPKMQKPKQAFTG